MQMDKIFRKINKVVNSGILIKGIYFLPNNGATEEEIKLTNKTLPHSLSLEYQQFLKYWNGINLDIIRLFGCGNVEPPLSNLLENQFDYNNKGLVIIGSDPAGFLYAENKDGEILSIDTDGGEFHTVADNFTDFICDYLFGVHAHEFAGEDWLNELKDHQLI
ncbi:SMI1/KNR4 family protein [Candidatus Odyssella thessalonicensis]|uniref:SMI1/KNR4 family protein n=1 Tax=Candidatus Odyssella thessalonicensis TaxID=84647 RepID=UPI000225AFA1|nr:SMI1/KNR4 family protein [Candidatus Odyssella thessalonicensis]